MEAGLSLQLQHAWLSTQILHGNGYTEPGNGYTEPGNGYTEPVTSVSSSSSSLSPAWSPQESENSTSLSSDSGTPSTLLPMEPYHTLEATGYSSYMMEGDTSFQIPWETLPTPRIPSIANDDMDEPDALMDPVLQYISDMLMDEDMEEHPCFLNECGKYQAIAMGQELGVKPLSCTCGKGWGFQGECTCDQGGGSPANQNWINEVFNDSGELSTPISSLEEQSTTDDMQWVFDQLPSPNLSGSYYSSSPSLINNHKLSLDEISSILDVSLSDAPLLPSDNPMAHHHRLSFVSGVQPHLDIHPPHDFRQATTEPSSDGVSHGENDLVGSRANEPSSMSLEETMKILLGNSSDGAELRKMIYGEYQTKSRQVSEGGAAGGRELGSDDSLPLPSPLPSPLLTDISVESRISVDRTLSYVKNEALQAEMIAERLYADGPLPCCTKNTKNMEGKGAGGKKEGKRGKKEGKGGKKEGKGGGKKEGEPEGTVDLRALLVSCAQAVGSGDLSKAHAFLQEVREHATPRGSATQRLAYYFSEALSARLSGIGSRLYTAMSSNRPSAAEMLKAFQVFMQACPFAKLSHYFGNQNILRAIEGATRVHIIDFGILYGFQWPCLISCLASRKGGPPQLRITGIDCPQPGVKPAERIEETGKRLSEYAKTYGVPFEYRAIANTWENVQKSDLDLREDEVLVVNCMLRLRHLMDESVVTGGPRQTVLGRIHSMQPRIFTVGVMNASFNAPFFVSRFREALYFFSGIFDMFDTLVGGDNETRLMLERELKGREILNVVACEGVERVERPETYRQWHGRFQRAGFNPIPLDQKILSRSQEVLKSCYHKEFVAEEGKNWMLIGWKGRIMQAISAWQP